MEILVIGHERGEEDDVWAFLNCAREPLEQRYGTLAKAARALRAADIGEREYKSAGFDQCQIHVSSLDALARLISAPLVRTAAGLLMYRVMRRGVNRYAKFHRSTLAARILAM